MMAAAKTDGRIERQHEQAAYISGMSSG